MTSTYIAARDGCIVCGSMRDYIPLPVHGGFCPNCKFVERKNIVMNPTVVFWNLPKQDPKSEHRKEHPIITKASNIFNNIKMDKNG